MAERSETREQALGILGGTFNPPHLGHLAVARHARQELRLEHVLLVPAHTAPYKSGDAARAHGRDGNAELGSGDPGPQHRLRMCQLALAGEQGLAVSDVEVERGGLSYTVDTLRSIHADHPNARLTFIVGADTAGTLGSWREPVQLLQLARLAVATRDGTARQRVLDAIAAVKTTVPDAQADAQADAYGHQELSAGERVSFLEMPAIEVSSSQVRERVARGEAIDQLVGPAVARYIAEHRLYRVPAAVSP